MDYPIYKYAKALNEIYCIIDDSTMYHVRNGLNGFFSIGVCEDKRVIKMMLAVPDCTEEKFFEALENVTPKIDKMADQLIVLENEPPN